MDTDNTFDKIILTEEEKNMIKQYHTNFYNLNIFQVEKIENDENVMKPAIIIEDYTFIFDKYYDENDTQRQMRTKAKLIVKNNKNNEKYKIEYYKSFSDYGLYRLLSFSQNKNIINKGKNYIFSSFVDMRLQKFLIENEKKCHEKVVFGTPEFILAKENLNYSLQKHPYNINSKLQNYIVDTLSRNFSEKPLFSPLTHCKPGHCFSKPNFFEEIKTRVEIEIAKKNDLDNIDKENNELKEYYENFLKKMNGIKKIDLEKKKEKIKNISLEEYYNVTDQSHISRFIDFKNLYKIMSLYLEEYCEIVSEPLFIYVTKFRAINEPVTIKLINNYYQVIIMEKKTRKLYQVIYVNIIAIKTNIKKEKNSKTLHLIIGMFPIPNKINILGLYEDVVDMGVYGYKLLDYNSQISFKRLDDYISPSPLSPYNMLGDLYGIVFPLNKLYGKEKKKYYQGYNMRKYEIKIDPNMPEEEIYDISELKTPKKREEKKYKKKYIKYKNKYLRLKNKYFF